MNHWFSTAYNIINLIKENQSEFFIIGSSENADSAIKLVCDEWYVEPRLSSSEYVDFCLCFCQKHDVRLFLPRRGMIEISRRISEFEDIGVTVMVEDYEIMTLFNHKSRAYEYFKANRIGFVPDYYIVDTVDKFLKSYAALKEKYKQVCFKFVKDAGGKSYRLIDNERKGYEALFRKQNTRMTLDDVIDALSERDVFSPIMIMPYLSGEEFSVDCLQTEDGLIMLPRVKDYSKVEQIRFEPKILDMCRCFQEKANLSCPYNIQFKFLGDTPYFLEVNTRMSGGIQMACLATGVNIPNIAVNKMLGNIRHWKLEEKNRKITQVLLPVLLND